MRASVGVKLLSGFGLVIVLTAVLGAVALVNLAVMNELTARLYSKELVAIQDIGHAQAALDNYRLATVETLVASDAAERNRLATRRRDAEAAFRQELVAIQGNLYTADGRNLYSQIDTTWSQYRALSDKVMDAATAGNSTEAVRLSQTTARQGEEQVSAALSQLSEWKSRLAADEARQAEQTYESVRNLTLALLMLALLVAAGIAVWLARAIGRGVKVTAQTAELIAAGDLTQTVSVRSRDEVGALGEAFNRMVSGLRELTGEIREGAQSLSAATSEIVASVAQQGASTTEQAAAVSQTTATVDEVRATAQQSSEKAQAVAAMAQRATDIAAAGMDTVETSMAGMRNLRGRVESIAEHILALSEQTQQVGEIIATVEDLADQSNLLAVNAAIEASGAGDQGRRFAVVAQEVRSLAERSKTATVQVRTILTDIQRATNAAVLATEQGTKGAEEGARLVEQAGSAIRQLDETIRHSAEAAQQIVASVGQQGAGMDQIAAAMTSINQATTETAAGTRQLQKSAENMNDLAQRLTNLLGRYKLQKA